MIAVGKEWLLDFLNSTAGVTVLGIGLIILFAYLEAENHQTVGDVLGRWGRNMLSMIIFCSKEGGAGVDTVLTWLVRQLSNLVCWIKKNTEINITISLKTIIALFLALLATFGVIRANGWI